MTTMERTVQSRGYQDPSEVYEKRVSWTLTFTETGEDSPIHIAANDWSGREIVLPVGVILEMAEVLGIKTPV